MRASYKWELIVWPVLNLMIKLALGGKKKIVKLEKADFRALRGLVKQSFPDAPADYILSYLDQDRDEISLGSDEDLRIMLQAGLKVNNVYIKQSLSQMIEITERIEPSFEVYEHRKEEPPAPHPQHNEHFRKTENRVLDALLPELPHPETKSIESKEPIRPPVEPAQQEKPEKAEEKADPPQKQEAEKASHEPESKEAQQVELKEESKEVKAESKEAKAESKEVKAEEEWKEASEEWPEKSENSKSFIISAADSRVEIDEQVLNERIEVAVKKIIESKIVPKKDDDARKEEVASKEEQLENKQLLEPERVKKAKIFEERVAVRRGKSEEELIYHGVICSSCKDDYGILGVRYQCILCDGFNICDRCESDHAHPHALLKVRLPHQAFKKEQLIEKYRNEINAKALPPGHYVPSISKDEANKYIETSKTMLNESMERAQRMINDMFLKMEMSHKNPYEQRRPLEKVVEPLKERIDHLLSLFDLDQKEARYFCEAHRELNKEQLAEQYLRRKTNKW